ncbi:hypothetical protein OG976_00330 [Mycobacterium sp. NBC_00419]|uniref:hypothetical protein n=1 Tax=Mycobacterium sp. NBC_00419 TaxID=2975989 RepID=UPI002E2300D1
MSGGNGFGLKSLGPPVIPLLVGWTGPVVVVGAGASEGLPHAASTATAAAARSAAQRRPVERLIR